MTTHEVEETEPTLARRLGLTSAIMVVIGSVVGSGIFLTPQRIAATVQIPGVMIFVWILTGLLTLAGALTNAEIAGMIPEAGDNMFSFEITYGDLTGFLYGWTTFIVYQTGSIAAIAVAFGRYSGYFINLPHLARSSRHGSSPYRQYLSSERYRREHCGDFGHSASRSC